MASISNIALPVSPKQVFALVQQLPAKDKAMLIHLLQQEQYANNIPKEHKKLVRSRIKKYNKKPKLFIDEQQALKMINAL